MVYKAIWEELQSTVHAVDQMTTKMKHLLRSESVGEDQSGTYLPLHVRTNVPVIPKLLCFKMCFATIVTLEREQPILLFLSLPRFEVAFFISYE